MAQLTWRNIDAPDFSSSIRALSDSNNQLQRAFSGVGQAFTDYGQRRQTENTGDIQLALAKYGTNADLQAAIQQGILDPNALREQYGNFNTGEIAKYQNQLATDLQGREVNQQKIDLTNNENQYGAVVAQALVDAGQGKMDGWNAIRNNPNIKGALIAAQAPEVQDAFSGFQTRTETQRSNMAGEANARANTAVAAQNAATNRLNVNSEIADRARRWEAGQLGRDADALKNQAVLDNHQATLDGAKQFDRFSNRTPAEQLEAYSNSLINTDPAVREAKIAGFKSAASAFLNPSNPGQAAAAAAVAPVSKEVSDTVSGAKSIISSSASQANVLNNVTQASEDSEIKTVPDAISALKADGLDTTDAKVNNFIKDAMAAGATPAEAIAVARGNGRRSYMSPIDGKITLDSGAALEGVREYMKYKTSTQGIQQRKSVAAQNQKVEALGNAVNNLLSKQSWYLQQGNKAKAASMQPEVLKAQQELNRYVGLVQQDNPVNTPAQPSPINWNGGSYPPGAPVWLQR